MTAIGFQLRTTPPDSGSPQTVEIDVFDVIGDHYDGVNAKGVADMLRDAGRSVELIQVRINSVGGAAFDGIAVHNLLVRHPARVEVEVLGLAASAASVVAAAGDQVTVAENALIMVHEAHQRQSQTGTATDHKQTAAALERLNRGIAATYTAACTRRGKKTGLTDWLAMMAGETWLSAREAVKLGLADKVGAAVKVAAQWDLSSCEHVPEHVVAMMDAESKAVPFKAYPLKREGAWDGSRAVQRMREWSLGSDGETTWSQYAAGFGWVDAEAADTFGAYKLPHHDVESGRMVTVRAGVIAAGNALQGSRGGVDIPAGEVAAVRNHLARHYREFDMTPPWAAQTEPSPEFWERLGELLERLPVVDDAAEEPEAQTDSDGESATLSATLGDIVDALDRFGLVASGKAEPATADAGRGSAGAVTVKLDASGVADALEQAARTIRNPEPPLHVTQPEDDQADADDADADQTTNLEDDDMDARILSALGVEADDDRTPEQLAEHAAKVLAQAEAYLAVGLVLDAADAEPEAVLAQVEALRDAAAELPAARERVAELEAQLEAEERAALVREGKAENKLTPSLIKLYDKRPLGELREFLAVAPVLTAAPRQEPVDSRAQLTLQGKTYEQLPPAARAELKRSDRERWDLMHSDWEERGKPPFETPTR